MDEAARLADALIPSSANHWQKRKSTAVILAAVLWLSTGCSLLSRLQLVFTYDTLTLAAPLYEILAAPDHQALLFVLTATAIAFSAIRAARKRSEYFPSGLICLFVASFPLFMAIARSVSLPMMPASIWELIWFASFSGMAVAKFASSDEPLRVHDSGKTRNQWTNHGCTAFVLLASCMATLWWFGQSQRSYLNFELGFNDFGHFMQRVANSAEGRGLLLESPVLPPFWDHFNPGLLLLVPFWKLWPHVEWIFAIQAGCLAMSAILVYSITKRNGLAPQTGLCWACVWLLQPSLGQMNLAYTYGWHPISMAIPFLLGAYRLQMSGQGGFALASLVLAMSFEEGVIAVVGCFAAAMGLRAMWMERTSDKKVMELHGIERLRPAVWFRLFLASAITFVIVYRFSGLAEFQTARFASLGTTPLQILLSPFLRPGVFWHDFFRERNFIFTMLLCVPLFLPALWRSHWHLLAISLPMGVLWLWQHLPAQSIAFQYSSTLLPVLILAAIDGGMRKGVTTQRNRMAILSKVFCGGSSTSCSIGAVLTCWVLSFYVGQMPWSRPTLPEVTAKTYGLGEPTPRRYDREDGTWLHRQIDRVRADRPRVLATGRIASHFVGMPDIETVGQFWQRYEQLASLDDAGGSPVRRFDIVIVDLLESFQQSKEETSRLVQEALKNGFIQTENRFDIVFLSRSR